MLEHSKIIDLPKFTDPRGNLTFDEGGVHVSFVVQKIYYLDDVPGSVRRGYPAPEALHQSIIASSGRFDLKLNHFCRESSFRLVERPRRRHAQ